MPSVLFQLDTVFRQAIREAFGVEADPLLTVAQNAQFGDYQSNVAMGLARQIRQNEAKLNPRAVALAIQEKLPTGGPISALNVAGPGFINVTLDPAWIAEQLRPAATKATAASQSQPIVVVDYSGPNIAKQMHVGHLRSTIIGDAIARILQNQAAVIRQNHVGDWGTQFGMLIERKLELESGIGELSDLEEEYRDAKRRYDESGAFQDRARQRVVELQAGDENIRAVWSVIVEQTRRHYQPLYQHLGVQLTRDDERGESFYNDKLARVVAELKRKGIAVESDGAVVVFIDGQGKSPLIIQKSDGGYLYGTTDLAAIQFRVEQLHANRIIYTHDSRQAQHFSQVFRTAEKAGWTRGGQVQLDYAPFGTMLGEDGKPFKTRSGETIKLKDLLDEAERRALTLVQQKNQALPPEQQQAIARAVGIGAVKYADLSKDRTSDYVFSWDKMLAMDGNTGPYLQYAYARVRSIHRKARSNGVAVAANATLELKAPQELTLAKHLLRFDEIVLSVARELKPHLLCAYLYDLATKFSGFYENCPVIQSEEPTRSSRLILSQLTADTLANGLDLLGIEHPEQM